MKFFQFSSLSFLFSMILSCEAHTFTRIPVQDTVDCVHIYHQPAFDHPALKNHTISMSPTSHPFTFPSSPSTTQKGNRCPHGTIPIIRRTSEKQQQQQKKKHPGRMLAEDGNHDHAVAIVSGGTYYGAKAAINLWQPQVEGLLEFSLAQMWVLGGPYDDINTLEAGWHVFPALYGDTATRFFIYWTSDGYRSQGCYNLQCPGFVQTSNEAVIGGILSPVSTYHGSQAEIIVHIWKDTAQNLWWLSVDGVTLGYWPGSLFTHLGDGASAVEWGGEVTDSRPQGRHTSTPMGSGHFAEEGFGGASYFSNLQVVDTMGNLLPPGDNIRTTAEHLGCYNIKVDHDDAHGTHLLFGGPGRNPNCT